MRRDAAPTTKRQCLRHATSSAPTRPPPPPPPNQPALVVMEDERWRLLSRYDDAVRMCVYFDAVGAADLADVPLALLGEGLAELERTLDVATHALLARKRKLDHRIYEMRVRAGLAEAKAAKLAKALRAMEHQYDAYSALVADAGHRHPRGRDGGGRAEGRAPFRFQPIATTASDWDWRGHAFPMGPIPEEEEEEEGGADEDEEVDRDADGTFVPGTDDEAEPREGEPAEHTDPQDGATGSGVAAPMEPTEGPPTPATAEIMAPNTPAPREPEGAADRDGRGEEEERQLEERYLRWCACPPAEPANPPPRAGGTVAAPAEQAEARIICKCDPNIAHPNLAAWFWHVASAHQAFVVCPRRTDSTLSPPSEWRRRRCACGEFKGTPGELIGHWEDRSSPSRCAVREGHYHARVAASPAGPAPSSPPEVMIRGASNPTDSHSGE